MRDELGGVAVEALAAGSVKLSVRQQAHVLGEHGEEAAHEEGGDGLRRVAGVFQRSGEARQAVWRSRG